MAPWVPAWKLLGYFLYLALYYVTCDAMWDYPEENLKTVAFKSLPILHLIFIILSTDILGKEYSSYKWSILLGLLFSMAGDACLVWRHSMFLPGLLCFAITHVLYIRGFGMTPFGGGPTVVSCMIVIGCAFLALAPGITDKDGPVMYLMVFSYTSLIFMLVWRSIVCLQTWPSRGPFFACLGSVLFAVSDFLLAFDKWRRPIDGAVLYVSGTYFMAQMCIAISVSTYTRRDPVKED